MRTFEEIHTDRLLMRRWREADREPFAELNGDPETLVFFRPLPPVMRRIGRSEVTRFEHPPVPDGSPLKPHVMYYLANPAAAER